MTTTQRFAGGAAVGIIRRHIDEVVLAELSFRFHAGVIAGLDLLAAVVAAILLRLGMAWSALTN